MLVLLLVDPSLHRVFEKKFHLLSLVFRLLEIPASRFLTTNSKYMMQSTPPNVRWYMLSSMAVIGKTQNHADCILFKVSSVK
jgi:hypothetical protein